MSMRLHSRGGNRLGRVLAIAALLLMGTGHANAQAPAAATQAVPTQEELPLEHDELLGDLRSGLAEAAVRLPLAAAFGTALALRPRRAGSPPRDLAVIETQIVLSIVGALIMLIVGASLARAFGIVGAANLIRYRSKIDDPKDAVVMLCALASGLAAGVGLYGLAIVGTLFIVFCLWIIEGFEPQTRIFELTVKMGDKTQEQRGRIEEVLRRYKSRYELRTSAEDAVCYMVTTPRSMRTDRVSNAIMELDPESKVSVEWNEKLKDKLPK